MSSRFLSPLRSLFSSRSATAPASGITASGSTSYQGWSTNARSAARGCGSAQAVVVAAPVADHDQVDVEGARRVLLAVAALAPEGVLDGLGAVEQPGRGQRGVEQHDGVEEVLGARGGVDRLGLVDRARPR